MVTNRLRRRRTDPPEPAPDPPPPPHLSTGPLRGADFVAVHELSVDSTIVARVGEPCTKVPPQSLAPLLDAGHIAPRKDS